jgi:hypothetical protein
MTLQFAILKVLDNHDPTPVPLAAIIADVNLMLPEVVIPSVVKHELELMDDVFVRGSKDEDRGLIFSLTQRGIHRVRK